MRIARPSRQAFLSASCLMLLLPLPAVGRPGNTQPGANQPAFDPFESSIPAIQSALSSGRTTSRALVAFYLARVAAFDRRGPNLHAIVTINPRALAEADRLDAERRKGRVRGPMHGIPILVKDNFETADLPTSAGTLALATNRPARDAELVRRLRAAGAIIIGKTSMHELATGVTGVSSLTGISRNPYDPLRSPGGSSGGTAAGVAANFAVAGIGSDTCGSIRIPAAYQNLFGLRVSHGLWSMEGVIPLSPSQDVAGPIARSADDLAIMMDAMTGSTERRYAAALHKGGLKGARFGVIRELTGDAPEDAAGKLIFDQSLAVMRSQGAQISDVTIPDLARRLKDSNVVKYEFSASLKSYLASRPHLPIHSAGEIFDRGLFHRDVDKALRSRFAGKAGDAVDAKAYARGLIEAKSLRKVVLDVMATNGLDALIYPTTLRPPPLIDGDERGGISVCQLSAGSGLPAITVPLGLTPEDLPVGMELLGPAFSEGKLISIADDWERVAEPRRVPFSTPRLDRGKIAASRITVPGLRKLKDKLAVTVNFDITNSTLRYTADLHGPDSADNIAVTLQSMVNGGPGPIITHLISRERHGEGEVHLSAKERQRLFSNELYIQIYSGTFPVGMIQNAYKNANLRYKPGKTW